MRVTQPKIVTPEAMRMKCLEPVFELCWPFHLLVRRPGTLFAVAVATEGRVPRCRRTTARRMHSCAPGRGASFDGPVGCRPGQGACWNSTYVILTDEFVWSTVVIGAF